jgi:hypothetical protein
MLPFRPNVKIFVPRQRVLLAWNGEEQILCMASVVRSSEPSLALEIIPLPSEPQVQTCDPATFDRARDLMANYLRTLERMKVLTSLTRREAAPWPHGQIVPHDPRVAQVRSGEELLAWVEDYLEYQDEAAPGLPLRVSSLLDPYLAEGFTWFVFHVVSLSPRTKARQPLQVRFRTPYLFYPLHVTRQVEGYTWMQMLSFVPQALHWACNPQFETVELFTEAGYVGFDRSQDDLAWVDGEMAELLGGEDPRLYVWHFGGKPGEVDQDIILPGGYVLGWDSPPF